MQFDYDEAKPTLLWEKERLVIGLSPCPSGTYPVIRVHFINEVGEVLESVTTKALWHEKGAAIYHIWLLEHRAEFSDAIVEILKEP